MIPQLKTAALGDGNPILLAKTRPVGSGSVIMPDMDSTLASIPGLAGLWALTHGDRRIVVALLDGPVDLAHPCFIGAPFTVLNGGGMKPEDRFPQAPQAGPRSALRHGTHLASILFGQQGSPVAGLAPNCRGLLIPIFESQPVVDAEEKDWDGGIQPCSQQHLAQAIALALEHGAQVINVSGGQFSPSGEPEPILADLIRTCAQRGVMIVAAAGNEGCDCLHVPAADETVLAVGAMDRQGQPLPFSNWGANYLTHGILAPGQDIVGARPGGGTTLGTGTSCATAIVSGVAALLLSLQLKRGQRPDTRRVREALLRSAIDCATQPAPDCRRLLAGRLNLRGSVSFITRSSHTMSDIIDTQPGEAATVPSNGPDKEAAPAEPASPSQNQTVIPSDIQAAACACQPGAGQLVYAIGQLDIHFASEARMDSIAQHINPNAVGSTAYEVAFNRQALLTYLGNNPWDAAAVTWTLNLHGLPIYAIQPDASFSTDAYARLRQCLFDQYVEQDPARRIERISAGGRQAGTTRLLNGQVVPVLVPEIRTLYSWNTAALAARVIEQTHVPPERQGVVRDAVIQFLERIYHGEGNLGRTPRDRALNYAATNALQAGTVFPTLGEQMELDTIEARPSPYCRLASDCWDVLLYFFDPTNVHMPRTVYRFTVDVSDVAPVFVGPVRRWNIR